MEDETYISDNYWYMQNISFIFKALWRDFLALNNFMDFGTFTLNFLLLKKFLSNNKSGKTRTTTNTYRTQRMKTQHTQSTRTRTIQQALNSCQLADHSPSTYTDIMQLFGNRIE